MDHQILHQKSIILSKILSNENKKIGVSRKIVCFGTSIHVLSWRQQKHQCLRFHYWDFLTNFWSNNWRYAMFPKQITGRELIFGSTVCIYISTYLHTTGSSAYNVWQYTWSPFIIFLFFFLTEPNIKVVSFWVKAVSFWVKVVSFWALTKDNKRNNK